MKLGVIGGSGVYDIDGLEKAEWRHVASPWGQTSDDLLFGQLQGVEVVFLPRHGRGHALSPSGINYRANIDALKRCGVTDILSVSACGSFRETMPPGTFVIVDQFIDRTFAREKSFFGNGLVAHVSVAKPVCGRLGDMLEKGAAAIDLAHVRGGAYLVMEGPQFSSLAESNLYRSWGCDVIGMTNMPEAKLAREAEICFATVAMVTDYDCWHPHHDDVDVASVIAVLQSNARHAADLVKQVVAQVAGGAVHRAPCLHGCDRALEMALMTAPEKRDAHLLAKLDAIAGRVLKGQ
ncbi:MAG: S-methyl-5'-thioadenosine phosphorylase [Alphaproteobacteria bacterium]